MLSKMITYFLVHGSASESRIRSFMCFPSIAPVNWRRGVYDARKSGPDARNLNAQRLGTTKNEAPVVPRRQIPKVSSSLRICEHYEQSTQAPVSIFARS